MQHLHLSLSHPPAPHIWCSMLLLLHKPPWRKHRHNRPRFGLLNASIVAWHQTHSPWPLHAMSSQNHRGTLIWIMSIHDPPLNLAWSCSLPLLPMWPTGPASGPGTGTEDGLQADLGRWQLTWWLHPLINLGEISCRLALHQNVVVSFVSVGPWWSHWASCLVQFLALPFLRLILRLWRRPKRKAS